MPSVRPKLVQEGAPIAKAPPPQKEENAVVKTADNLYVIGGGGGQQPQSSLNSSRSSLSMHVSASDGLDASFGNLNSTSGTTTGRRRSSANKKGTSSLARAAKGTFLSDKKKQTQKKPTVQTSFVVGASSNAGEEKKSEMADDSSKRRASSSVISTSFQVPFNGHNSFTSTVEHMDLEEEDGSNRGITAGRRKSRTSIQATAYVIGGAADTTDTTATAATNHEDSAEMEEISMNNETEMETIPIGDDEAVVVEQQPPQKEQEGEHQEPVQMEGVIDLSEKPPLCVLDGANLAYAYAKAGKSSSLAAEQTKPDPDTKGIQVACEYFESAGIRVLAVLPQTWTLREHHQTILKKLEEKGVLVEAPSRDDDDAYAITIARREDAKARQRGDGPGYVMSNDMFRDAAARAKEETGSDDLKVWLTEGSTLESGKTGPGRISFAFLDTGSMDDHGDKVLDIMPNPRHPLIQFVEQHRHGAAAGAATATSDH